MKITKCGTRPGVVKQDTPYKCFTCREEMILEAGDDIGALGYHEEERGDQRDYDTFLIGYTCPTCGTADDYRRFGPGTNWDPIS